MDFVSLHKLEMEKRDNKIVYTNVEEILDPSHTALVVWDVQNLLVDKIFNKQEFMNNLISMVEIARKSNVPVFFTRIQMLPIQFESPSRLYTFSKLGLDRIGQPSAEDMALTIKPDQNEIVIDKHTASIFIDTGFERMIRNAGIVTIVFTGIATEFGVESSAREALSRGFYSVVVSDIASSPDREAHGRSLKNMEKMMTVINSKEIENIWSKST
ncbi:MAG: cysteine hydrolase [Nitrososphaeraceae archaeon]